MSPRLLLVAAILLAACDGSDAGAIDAIDADRRCEACTPDQICVQLLHGNIGGCQDFGVNCETRHPACVGTECTPDCRFWQCSDGMDAGGISCPNDLNCTLAPGALHFVADPARLLARLAARLRPGGHVVVVEYDRQAGTRWVPHPIPRARWPEVATAAGLIAPRVAATRPSEYGGDLYVAAAMSPLTGS